MSKKETDLRTKVIKGVTFLTIRNAIVMVLGLIGTFLIARVLGPEIQGLYYSALNLQSYFLLLLAMKNTNYLIIHSSLNKKSLFNLVFSWHCLVSIPIGVLGAIVTWLLYRESMGAYVLLGYLSILFISIPFSMTRSVFIAILEKKLEYKKVASVEVITQLSYYVCAIVLIQLGLQGFSLPIAVLISEFLGFVSSLHLAQYRPRWYWNSSELWDMLKVSFGQSVPDWINRVDRLALPLIVLPMIGTSAVAYITLAERFISMLSFPKGAVGRVSLPVLANIQNDKSRMNKAVNEGLGLQTFLIGGIYALFAGVAWFALPLMLGQKWDTNILVAMFGLLATRSLLSTFTALQGSALVVLKKNFVLILVYILYAITFVVSLLGLVYLLPPSAKVYAYGVAEVAGMLATGIVRHWGYSKYVGKPDYRLATVWSVAFICAFFAPALGWWLYGITILLLLTPASRAQMVRVYQMLSPPVVNRLRGHSSGRDRKTDSSTGSP